MTQELELVPEAPKIAPIKVEKKKPTGVREMSTIVKSLDAIHNGMVDFIKTINRSGKKENQIAARLCELKDAIIDAGGATEEIQEILEDLDSRIFEETFYTEKSGGNVIRMTDDTRLSHLRAFATEAAKVAHAKFKMSADDYVPKATVVLKLQRSIDIFRRVLKENAGPALGEVVVKETMDEIIGAWDGQ